MCNFAGHMVEHGVDLQVFPCREFAVEAGILEDDSETLARLVLVRLRVETVEFDTAAGGVQQRGEHLDGGGFTSAIGTQEGEDFSGLDVEGHVVNGGKFVEVFNEIADPDHGFDLQV
jgi:hypothetical protein